MSCDCVARDSGLTGLCLEGEVCRVESMLRHRLALLILMLRRHRHRRGAVVYKCADILRNFLLFSVVM